MLKILFVGGGSVGHIAPSVAVWRAVKQLQPTAEAHFVCTNREDDQEFLTKECLEYTAVAAPRLSWKFPWKYIRAHQESKKILCQFKPDVVFSNGGYASIPTCFAASRAGIPIVLHESDAASGRANMLIQNWAKVVCSGFPGENRTYTGNPIRPSATSGSRDKGLRITGFSGNRPIVLVTGGSQGSVALNSAITKNAAELLSIYDIIHITGRGKETDISEVGYWQCPFVVTEFPHLLAAADIALSRAGTGSIGELAANSIPTIFVPLRGVGHDHQQKNVEVISASDGCTVLQESMLSENLLEKLQSLHMQLSSFSKAIHTLYNPNAAQQIAKLLIDCIAS